MRSATLRGSPYQQVDQLGFGAVIDDTLVPHGDAYQHATTTLEA